MGCGSKVFAFEAKPGKSAAEKTSDRAMRETPVEAPLIVLKLVIVFIYWLRPVSNH
jgi:hypothetical protein